MCLSRTEPAATAGRGLRPRVARWLQRSSLWQRLALLLLPGLAAVTALELWMTRHDALESANSAYDRSLLGALKSIDANISTASGGLSLEMPYTMFEFFELTASGQVFFRVATSDGLVELGSADFPQPTRPPPRGVPVFYDAMYFGEPVRLAAYERELERTPAGSTARRVMIQVGESTQSREVFSARFVRSAALRDLLVLLLMLGGTTFALLAALRPLSRLAQEVEARPARRPEPHLAGEPARRDPSPGGGGQPADGAHAGTGVAAAPVPGRCLAPAAHPSHHAADAGGLCAP